MSAFRVEFITPLFSHGAYEDRPEIRPASIRGQLHWWFRALGGGYADERAIFGGVHNGASASRIVVRVSEIKGETAWRATLPHKPHGRDRTTGPDAPKAAFLPRTSFRLDCLERLGGIQTENQKAMFARALECWLLLGSLGLRATRGGGSFKWEPLPGTTVRYPAGVAEYAARCGELLKGSRLRFSLLGTPYGDGEAARRVITNTLGGPDREDESADLKALNWPLGDVASHKQRDADPSRHERKTSPLRLRVVAVGRDYRIAAVWDGRTEVTGNRPGDLQGVIRLLAERKPELGAQLAPSNLARE
jgi:hypothetical protein